MRVFLTGVTGFAGSYLIGNLLAENHDVTCLVRSSSNTDTLPNHPFCRAYNGDLLDQENLNRAIEQSRPDIIYHLAGMAATVGSWNYPSTTLAVNTIGTANILEAALTYGKCRVVVVTSGDIYGIITADDLPITEDTLTRPRHPYGVSKWAASELVRVYWERYQLPAIEARPFNHIGPRQRLGFVVPDFASQLAKIKLGLKEAEMSVGNLSARRDFTDVRDVVRAYKCIGESGEPGQRYLICSGKAISIQYILDSLIEISGVDVKITQDPTRMRPSDTPVVYGSYKRLHQDTGWEPKVPLEESLVRIFDYWTTRIADS